MPSITVSSFMQYYEVLILLYRPFIQTPNTTCPSPLLRIPPTRALQVCTESATEISRLLKIFRQNWGLSRLNVYSVHVLMTSAMIHVYSAGDRTNPRQAEAQVSARESIQALSELSKTFECSTRAFEVVTSIRRDWQDGLARGQKGKRRRDNVQ